MYGIAILLHLVYLSKQTGRFRAAGMNVFWAVAARQKWRELPVSTVFAKDPLGGGWPGSSLSPRRTVLDRFDARDMAKGRKFKFAHMASFCPVDLGSVSEAEGDRSRLQLNLRETRDWLDQVHVWLAKLAQTQLEHGETLRRERLTLGV